MPHILIVEDEPGIAFGLESDLQTEGYQVSIAVNGGEAVLRARSGSFDLILLDISLPGKDGFDVCRELRHAGMKVPIIMLTAMTHEAEKIMGLDVGADDYMTKPFSSRELRARIRALLRRATPDAGKEAFQFGCCELDLARFELRRQGRLLESTPTELRLLAAFIRGRGRALTREQLIEEVWGSGVYVTDRVVDTYVVSLRKKIEDDPSVPRYLVSVRGIGYRFDG